MFLIIAGGWLLSLWTYMGIFPGLLYGLKDSSLKSKVTSRKLTTLTLAVAVVPSPCFANICVIFCFRASACLGVAGVTARKSSL